MLRLMTIFQTERESDLSQMSLLYFFIFYLITKSKRRKYYPQFGHHLATFEN